MPERFLGPSDFVGVYDKSPEVVYNGLQSTYDGTVVVTMVDRSAVETLLTNASPRLKLATPAVQLPSPTQAPTEPAAVPRHPIIHLIGAQREPSTLANRLPFNVGGGYDEMVLLVPFVTHDSYSGWHNFAARMYLNHSIPVDQGNMFYGYAKELASLDSYPRQDAFHYSVSSPTLSKHWFVSDIRATGPLEPYATAIGHLPRWTDLCTMMNMPMLGMRKDSSGVKWLCSYWELNFDEAELAAATSEHRMVSPFGAGFDAISQKGKLDSAEDGAVMMFGVRWRLALPARGCKQ